MDQPSPRYAREDIHLDGHVIPRGATVMPLLASANRDESVFENPDTLDITRKPNRHVAFGMGVHYCLGRRWRGWRAPSRCSTWCGASPR